MKKAVLIFTLICLVFTAKNITAQNLSANERAMVKIKSVFIYNFTLYIDWPDAYKSGKFVVGILADNSNKKLTNAMYTELQNMARTKKAGTQPFQIELFSSVNDISKCHIVYMPEGVSNKLSQVIKRIDSKNYHTLIVTDKEGLAKKGAAVNFVRVESRQKFELNEKNAKKYGLKLAAKFKNLAIIVE